MGALYGTTRGAPRGIYDIYIYDMFHHSKTTAEDERNSKGLVFCAAVRCVVCVRVHLHAVREDAVHAVFHLGVLVLQVVEALLLPLALLLQHVHVLPVDPDGEGRGSVQDPVQLGIGDG